MRSNSRSREISALGIAALTATLGVPPQNCVCARAGVRTMSSQSKRVPSDTWDEAHKAFGDEGLGQLVMVVTTINAWNRIGVSTRMVPESYAG